MPYDVTLISNGSLPMSLVKLFMKLSRVFIVQSGPMFVLPIKYDTRAINQRCYLQSGSRCKKKFSHLLKLINQYFIKIYMYSIYIVWFYDYHSPCSHIVLTKISKFYCVYEIIFTVSCKKFCFLIILLSTTVDKYHDRNRKSCILPYC